ncbi:MAG: ATP-dependent helicase, partial [Bacteroidota bacterium]
MYTRPVPKEEVVDVVYNFYQYANDLYLLDAYVVTRDKENYLAHIKQKATTGTIGAFKLELDAQRKVIFQLINELQPDHLVKRFHQGRRKAPPLTEMLKERELLKAIRTYVHRRLDTILQLINKHHLPISLEVERRVLVKDF